MIETIKQMRRRHEKEIKALEKGCSHKKLSGWMDYAWAPGHFAGRVKVCENCGKIIERDNKPGPLLQKLSDNLPRLLTEEEIKEI